MTDRQQRAVKRIGGPTTTEGSSTGRWELPPVTVAALAARLAQWNRTRARTRGACRRCARRSRIFERQVLPLDEDR